MAFPFHHNFVHSPLFAMHQNTNIINSCIVICTNFDGFLLVHHIHFVVRVLYARYFANLCHDLISTVTVASPFPFTGTPAGGQIIGYIDVTDEMHYEFDITFDAALGDTNADIFSCGVGFAQTSMGPFGSGFRFGIPGVGEVSCDDFEFADASNLCYGNFLGPVTGETYHLEIDFTQSWVNVRQSGQVIYSKHKDRHATNQNAPCYVSADTLLLLGIPILVPAEHVTLSNLMVTSEGSPFCLSPMCIPNLSFRPQST